MLGITLIRDSELPLKRQVYQQLKERITNGQLNAGEMLPSTRELCNDLGVSRNTVSEAYEMLLAEGFVITKQGSPTRVAPGLCVEQPAPAPRPSLPRSPVPVNADFSTGRPALDYFPWQSWHRLLARSAEDMPLNRFGYGYPQGALLLREEIVAWLYRSRGLTVLPQDIFITSGATNALHLIAELLCRDKRGIIIEDPCHKGMLHTFLNKQCSVLPVMSDEQGLQTDRLPGINHAAGVYVTPSHQFPLGGILPASRRASLVRFAREQNLYIIEDDYDSEFRYSGAPIAPLYSLDPQRVIYVGTFSKALFPALRIGFAILPPLLHEKWKDLRICTDVQNPPYEQEVLARFLKTRGLDRHISRMRRLYGQRRLALLSSLKKHLREEWGVSGDAAGLHLAIDLPGRRFDDAFVLRCRDRGIILSTVESHAIEKGRHPGKLLLGYGHLTPQQIDDGIRLLCERL